MSTYATEDNAKKVAANDYLARVNLMAATSGLVQDGKMPVGKFALVFSKSRFVNLGETFDFGIISWKPHAMRFLADGGVENAYDPDSAEYKAIVRDSSIKGARLAHGPEYLIWLAEQKVFATFLLGNPTLKREKPMMDVLINKKATLTSERVKKGQNSWHGIVVTECSSPFETTFTKEEFDDAVNKFNDLSTKPKTDQPAEEVRDR